MPASPSAASPHSSSRHNPPSSITSSSRPANPSDHRRDSFPFSFTRPFRANPSSTSLVPSTAEGRPIPVDDSTAENRTSALREINSHYPSRHRYAKSTGAQSSTYSEPVIVRSYHPPAPSRPAASTRSGGIFQGGAVSGSDAGRTGSGLGRGLPFASKVASAGNGMLSTMARARTKRSPGDVHRETRLPPVEAFSFKSFMANLESQTGSTADINADLDRIAEICARSRYSLSNQYEVHYAPHGSGTAFLAASQQNQEPPGPTLQVVSSDDERNMGRQRKRRQAGRRNSRAMGTLETIMSSSRSSDEDKTKKKSASELAEEVRGRAVRKESEHSSPSASSQGSSDGGDARDGEAPSKHHARRPSGSLALIDGSKQNVTTTTDGSNARTSASGLLSELALPQASTSQLELRTASEQQPQTAPTSKHKTSPAPPTEGHAPLAKGSMSSTQVEGTGSGIMAALSGWMAWGQTGKQEGRAEGSLRHLLKTTDFKNKGANKAA
ncbi:hypothetical protein JDV02_005104 [Purpureocillium takamizusanense]|uniref:Uncharacterized protein n=1 Tax=Purpureocillium takamizusanense TaxID=2060973 RepID=A0A9Q8QDQ2_9HYPO|nr:uncharacterized protein JDV02_005104 [Purpureocillium takamizusanense]UNI18864.1 hypothetical protein JDV02_005104 [Purpureocillium takamizusanense]